MRSPSLRRASRAIVLTVICAGVLAFPNAANAASSSTSTRHDMKTVQGAAAQDTKRPGGGGNGISYHGGPILLGTPNVYVIWYGNWAGNTATTILTDLLSNIGGSPYYNINTTYFNGANTHITNAVHYAGSANDSYSQGVALTDAGVKNVVSNAIATNALPSDLNALYFVLTSKDVAETSGFLTVYCGWHDHGSIGGKDIKYSFVGDATGPQASSCMVQTAKSPNNNPGADGMASVIAHELEETTTDPDLNAWYDNQGMENADKCAWTFGAQYPAANGSKANMKLGTRDFLIQRNWLNALGGKCVLKF